MDLKKIKEHEYPLLQRTRITYEVEHEKEATPAKAKLKEEIAKSLKVEPNLIAIRHIYSKFGAQKSKIIVHVYEDEKTLKFLEPPKGKKVEKKEKAPAAK